jgi:hypothetical protein
MTPVPPEPLVVPPPDELMRRIAACRDELKALQRLLRMSRAADLAQTARQARERQPMNGNDDQEKGAARG